MRGALAARAIERFGIDAGRLHVDLTTLRVAGAYEHSALVAKGWGPDRSGGASGPRAAGHQRLRRVALRAPGPRQRRRGRVDRRLLGAPQTTGLPGAGDLRRRLRVPQDAVPDRALGPCVHRAATRQHGVPRALPRRRRRPGRCERSATSPSASATCRAALRTRYRGALRDWQITDPETNQPLELRVAYIHSSEEAREVAAARERALSKAEEALARVQRGLGGRYYKTRRQVDAQDREDPHRTTSKG